MSRGPNKIIEFKGDKDHTGTKVPVKKKCKKVSVREKMTISEVFDLIDRKRKELD